MVSKTDFDAWNSEERLYGCMMLHRKRRTLKQRLLRRPPEVCPHLYHAVCTRVEAVRKAREAADEFPCVVVLLDLEAETVVDRWITDPAVENLHVDRIQRDLTGYMEETSDAPPPR